MGSVLASLTHITPIAITQLSVRNHQKPNVHVTGAFNCTYMYCISPKHFCNQNSSLRMCLPVHPLCQNATPSPPPLPPSPSLPLTLPQAYRYPVSLFNVEDEVLYEGHLVQREDDLKPGSCHLCEGEEVEGGGVNLQVAPPMIRHHSAAVT